jgi:hypothetical protein
MHLINLEQKERKLVVDRELLKRLAKRLQKENQNQAEENWLPYCVAVLSEAPRRKL